MSEENETALRLWLLYPQRLVLRPVIFELSRDFNLTTNIRQASVNDDIGLVSLEVKGSHDQIDEGIAWLEGLGIKVEPVEVNVVDS